MWVFVLRVTSRSHKMLFSFVIFIIIIITIIVITTVTLNDAGWLNLNFLEAEGVGLQESFSTRLLKPTSGSRFATA